MLLTLLVAAAALVVAGAFAWDRHRMAVATIEGELRRRRAVAVRIRPAWLDADRDTLTYDVAYADRAGRRHATRCKVSRADDATVYWEHPLPPG